MVLRSFILFLGMDQNDFLEVRIDEVDQNLMPIIIMLRLYYN